MPVLVNPKVCVDREHCFAAGACPYDAFIHNPLKKTWEVDATVCGECPGPCLNFCDRDALRWDDLVDLRLVKAEMDGTMTPQQVAEERLKHKEEMAALARQKSAEGVIELTRANFEREVIRSQVPVVVDCWADWCGPCKQFSPIFNATAKQYVGVVKFAKLDTDAEQALARGLGIQALPTLLMFYQGQIVNAVEGALPTDHFNTWIYQTLAAIRQYETQLTAEAGDAVDGASQRLATMNDGEEGDMDMESGMPEQAPQAGGQGSPGLILDRRDDGNGSRGPQQGSQAEPPGRRTSSGLYIP